MQHRPSTLKATILSHVVVNSTGTVLSLAAHAVLLTWLIRDLGLAAYGVYALATAMALQFHLFEDSLGSWITREVARERDPAALSPRLGGALALHALLGLPVLSLVAVLTVFGLRGQGPAVVGLALAVGGAGFGFELLGTFARKMLEGRERFGLIKSIQVTSLLLRLAGIAAVRFLAPGADRLTAYALVFLASVACQTAVSVLVVRAVFGPLPRPVLRGALPVWRAAARFGAPIFGVKCTTLLSGRLDLWIVASLLTPADVGVYGIATRLYGLVLQAIEVSRSFILPLAVRLRHELSPARFHDFFLRATSLSTLLTFGAATVVALNAAPVIRLWLGPAALAAVTPLLLLLAFAMTAAFRSVGQTVLLAEGRFGVLLAPFVTAGVINFGVSVAASLAWGVAGPALGTLVGGAVLLGWNVPRILRVLGVAPAAYVRTTGPDVLVWLAAAAAGYAIGLVVAGVPGLIAATTAYLGAHALLFFTCLLNRADRAFLLGMLRSRERSLAA
ncbi:MAG: oligosaccharide flippase family protein [Planctomycetes bacterium]|nr:oligosaccharide flippase family protein [Planctomycetota bacterium]